MFALKFLCAFTFLLAPVVVTAADITTEQISDGPLVIRIKGEFKPGDDERFRRISLRHPAAVVHLQSEGGALIPALEIGRIIRIAGYTTVVVPGSNCASACALVWLAGKKRYLSGNVGFHAAYRTNDGRLQESGTANALIGNYMTLLGLPAKAIVFATAAPPDKVLWLTAGSREATGIDFEMPPPPISIAPAVNPSQATVAPVVSIPPPANRSNGVRVLEKEFFLNDNEGRDLYNVTFIYRGLKHRYPIPIDGEIESLLQETFEEELYNNDGWIGIYLDGEINERNMVGYDIHHPSISRIGRNVEAWVREDHQFNKNVRHRRELTFARFYCGERSVSLLEGTKYDAQGKVLSSEELSGNKIRLAPNTIFEPIYDAICPFG